MKRILLTAEDFKKLIAGEVVSRYGVQILLSDVGYDFMLAEVSKKKDELWLKSISDD